MCHPTDQLNHQPYGSFTQHAYACTFGAARASDADRKEFDEPTGRVMLGAITFYVAKRQVRNVDEVGGVFGGLDWVGGGWIELNWIRWSQNTTTYTHAYIVSG